MKKLQLTYSYDDITLVPGYSELESRSRTNVAFEYFSLPIMSAPMDTLGVDLMETLTRKNIPFVAHRAFKSAEEQWNYFIPNGEFTTPFFRYQNIWWAVGSSQKYSDWIKYLYNKGVRKFCVDMAHGDSKACVDTIKFIKELDKTSPVQSSSLGGATVPLNIIAGNVATAEGFKRLQAAGADGIRVGIASGQICFTGDTVVTLYKGHGYNFYQKQIKHVKVGDLVITASGKVREVINTFKNPYIGEIYKINNDIKVTPTHKFHVYDHVLKEKIYLPIKDYDEERYSFLDANNKTHKVYLDIDEYVGDVYNIEVDDEHTYTVGNLMFGVSNCSTAIHTGFGVPIISSIIDCAKVKKNTLLIADGGIKNTGDIVKAKYFGADLCMIGKLFASTDKASGKCFNNKCELITNPIYPEYFKTGDTLENLVVYKDYHGMASRVARENLLHYASVEGVSGLIKYTGTTEMFLNDVLLRLQAALSYAGAKNWDEFKKKTYPVIRSNAGIIAGGTHLDITTDF